MFHKLDAYQPQSIFRYLPMLSFTESYIYQVSVLIILNSYWWSKKIEQFVSILGEAGAVVVNLCVMILEKIE